MILKFSYKIIILINYNLSVKILKIIKRKIKIINGLILLNFPKFSLCHIRFRFRIRKRSNRIRILPTGLIRNKYKIMYNHHLKDNYLKNLNLMLMVSLLSKNHQYKIYNNNQQILTSVSQLNQMHNPNLKNNSLKIKKREGWILYLKYLF